MEITLDLDEQILKTKLSEGLDINEAIDACFYELRIDLNHKIMSEIKKTNEYKEIGSYKPDSDRLKEAIKKLTLKQFNDLILTNVAQAVRESEIPKIVKSRVKDYLKEYVDEMVVREIKGRYNFEVGIKVTK